MADNPDYVLRGAVSSLIEERNNLETMVDMLAQALETAIQQRDEARDWARRMKRERDEARDLLGMMDIDKIAENLEKMRRWLK